MLYEKEIREEKMKVSLKMRKKEKLLGGGRKGRRGSWAATNLSVAYHTSHGNGDTDDVSHVNSFLEKEEKKIRKW